ncbi:hypothetical protein F8388_014875 [Cannabis sativa]|uniref:Polygalacturonase n=1 Tax=Cannabis sativa TaxID=3483 RepID=A0A7J6F629_CANSA|nr:hypothetical protein F8388_014875 [Cannabis sativa]
MKKSKSSSLLILLLILVLIFVITFSTISVEARKHQTKKNKPHNKHKKDNKGGNNNNNNNNNSNSPCPSPVPPHQPPSSSVSNIFNVLSFGAKGDGVSDDSKALLAAWEGACKVSGATVIVPSKYKFLIKPIILQGPCMPHLIFQIDGTLLAPPKIGSWQKYNLFQWIYFKWINNFTIQGTGVVDGQGSNWWCLSQVYNTQKKSKYIPDMKPTFLLTVN